MYSHMQYPTQVYITRCRCAKRSRLSHELDHDPLTEECHDDDDKGSRSQGDETCEESEVRRCERVRRKLRSAAVASWKNTLPQAQVRRSGSVGMRPLRTAPWMRKRTRRAAARTASLWVTVTPTTTLPRTSVALQNPLAAGSSRRLG